MKVELTCAQVLEAYRALNVRAAWFEVRGIEVPPQLASAREAMRVAVASMTIGDLELDGVELEDYELEDVRP